jgi:hypothetical protein
MLNLKELSERYKDVAISFSVFCAENCFYEDGWWNRNWRDEALTTEELFKIFEDER